MNKQPIYYMQTDPRWKDKPYRVPGENATIGGSGCGPSCAAMLIETLTGKTYTPEDACNWSMAHGYKALNQGTYYSYFKPQFAEFGIDCAQLNGVSLYGKTNDAAHDRALEMLRQGCYLIACMGPGIWTSGGHFVVVWWEDGKVRINDPASTRETRLNGDLQTFKSQVKYYFWVDAQSCNQGDDDMDINKLSDQDVMALWERTMSLLADQEPSSWSAEARHWAEGTSMINGDEKGRKQYKKPLTREEYVQLEYNQSRGG